MANTTLDNLGEQEQKLAEDIKAELLTSTDTEENTSDPKESLGEDSVRELSDFEQEAVSKGWNPKGPSSAEEWLKDKPLYEEITKRGKHIKNLERTMQELKSFIDKQEKLSYQKAMHDLTSSREAAISLGDINKVKIIEDQIQKVPIPQQVNNPAAEDFLESNKDWFSGASYDAKRMTEFTRERDKWLGSRGLPPEEHFALLQEHIEKEFPEYFNKKQRVNAYSNVESTEYGSTMTQNPKKTWSRRDLSKGQRQAAEDFEKHGIMKVDDYIKELVKMGELK